MSEKIETVSKPKDQPDDKQLPAYWKQVHGAIWMIGLAILFWQGWIFPGIFVLIAVSSLAEVGMRAHATRQRTTEALTQARELHLPDNCPNCGGPISPASVQWRGPQTAVCPFCASSIKAVDAASIAAR